MCVGRSCNSSSVGMTQAEGVRPFRGNSRSTPAVEHVDAPAQPAASRQTRERIWVGVLADARGEYQGVQPFQDRGERGNLPADAVNEVIDREPSIRFVAGQQVAHVIGDAGESLQTGMVVEQVLHLVD